MPTLTEDQQELLRWIVECRRTRHLKTSFQVATKPDGCYVRMASGSDTVFPVEMKGILDALAYANYLRGNLENHMFGLWRYTLTGLGEELVNQNFVEPAPVPSQVTNLFYTDASGGYNQIGTHNKMEVKTAVETIAQNINNSTASFEQREAAKNALTKFLKHPAVVATIGRPAPGASDKTGR